MPQFDKQKIHFLSHVLERIRAAVYKPIGDLNVQAYVSSEPLTFENPTQGRQMTLKPGDTWAANVFDCAWFHLTGTVPNDAAGADLVLLIDVNGEACVVDSDGTPLQGLTNINSEFDKSLGMPGKNVVPWSAAAKAGGRIDLWADAGANDLFGRMQEKGTLKQACMAIRHPHLFGLQWDWEVLHELMVHLPEQSARRWRLWDALVRASDLLFEFNETEAAAARAILAPELAKRGGDPSLTISAIGHAHMDLAWLWPIRETIRKCARTFATALRMLERYPDYVFGASQPQQYQWVKEHYPALYAQVKKRVAEGRWEAQGVMWVEPDTNVPSGESLIRQIIYGTRFFREEFGVRPKILWEPDVFGYSGALPQILKKSGVDFFMTQKLSWNQVTKHPHHTFWWQGIDGSRVLAHMPPEDTYNGPAAPRSLVKIERDYLDKNVSDRALMLFGIGDGGGGPGEEHLERLAREHNLAGVCPVVQEPAEKFFAALAKGADRYATWTGELYLEKHQGTFTTQGRSKRFNRKIELALRELELAATIAGHLCGSTRYKFPKDQIDAIWREFLLYQFHDILPGSSIGRVYDESLPRYQAMAQQIHELTAQADQNFLASLRSDFKTITTPPTPVLRYSEEPDSSASDPALRSTSEPASGVLKSPLSDKNSCDSTAILNSLSWERSQWLKIDDRWHWVTAPAMGIAFVTAASQPELSHAVTASDQILENELLRVEFNTDGSIAWCLDKRADRHVISAPANVLAIYDDPGDAWDFSMDYHQRRIGQFSLTSVEHFVDGPRAVIRHTRTYNKSTLRQDIVLTAGSAVLEFITTVDWQESGRMLRTSFPTTVVATEAACDIQFGSIRRPTHRNTLRDVAMMEVCAHKFVDLSDRGYGVALLNDCKYGHALMGQTIDLNLLRSPGYPDATADRATHQFVYALVPHLGDHVTGGVIQAGYELNVPLRVLGRASGAADQKSWISVDAKNVIIETVKPSEEGAGWIIRLYESTGASTDVTVTLPATKPRVSQVSLLEEAPQPQTVESGKVALRFGPFEIQTLLVR